MDIARFSSGSPWEARVGYSRAVRVGDRIYVAGTTGILADGQPAEGLEAQARRAIDVISDALIALGGSLDTVVRTRTYLTDISDWEVAGRVQRSGRARPRAPAGRQRRGLLLRTLAGPRRWSRQGK